MLPRLLSSQYAMTNPGTITFCLPQRVHSVGLLASHYFRSVLIPCSMYIDDRHTREIQLPSKAPAFASLSSKSLSRASSGVFIICHTLIGLGYFFGLKKPFLTPKRVVPYLGCW